MRALPLKRDFLYGNTPQKKFKVKSRFFGTRKALCRGACVIYKKMRRKG
jgi:hypothetical protein